jgi:uncharacterized protein YabN with tetrapyrrole methylase and pyrophosphatase domain
LKLNLKGEKTDMCKAWDDHRNSGKIEERNLINRLNSILIEHNRLDDLKRSTEDESFQTELINELVLKTSGSTNGCENV